MAVPAWVCVFFLAVVQPVRTQGETRKKCDVPASVSSQEAVCRPPLQFSVSPVRETTSRFKFTFEDGRYSVVARALTIYLKSSLLQQNILLTEKEAACFRRDGDSMVTEKAVAKATIVYDVAHQNEIAIAYNTFPNSTQETMICKASLNGFELRMDVTTTFTGCPGNQWGKMCDDVCPCQNGGHCVNPFWVECLCPVGTSGQLCQNVTSAAHNETKHTTVSAMDDSAVETSNNQSCSDRTGVPIFVFSHTKSTSGACNAVDVTTVSSTTKSTSGAKGRQLSGYSLTQIFALTILARLSPVWSPNDG